MAALATVTELRDFLEVAIEDNSPRASRVLSMASNLVRGYAGHPEWVAADPVEDEVIAPAEAIDLVLQSAGRAYLGPKDGARQMQRTSGPYSVQRSYAEAGVYLTEDEEARLDRLAGRDPDGDIPGLWTLRTYRDDMTGVGVYYADVVYSDGTPDAEPMPLGTVEEMG